MVFQTQNLITSLVVMLVLLRNCGSLKATTTAVSHYSRILDKHTMDALYSRVCENNVLIHGGLAAYMPFKVQGHLIGYINKEFSHTQLSRFPDVITVSEQDNMIRLTSKLDSGCCETRTQALASVTAVLKDEGVIRGWRNELVEAVSAFNEPPAFLIERAAYPFFGVRGYGIHVNGFVKNPVDQKAMNMWVAKRSKTKSLWPSMLDHIVAGGLPTGVTLTENVIKECDEEASIPEYMASAAVPVGVVSYSTSDSYGNLKRDVLFCYDLELPEYFIPIPRDGEVESFDLHDVDWVLRKLVEGGPKGYKPNVNIVVIDFLIRHGIISPESHGYIKLVHSLRAVH